MTASSHDRGEILWSPPADVRERSRIGGFLTWLEAERGLAFPGYTELWEWSVADLDGFWTAFTDWIGVRWHDRPRAALGRRSMPGTEWFPGATLNYAEHALAAAAERADDVAIVARSQTRDEQQLTWAELADQVARCRAGFLRLGVQRGDRVAAYLPNIPETVVAFLATASIGAIWSSCAPEFGVRSVVDRFAQIEPVVLLAVDGYQYGAKTIDHRDEVAEVQACLPSLRHTVRVPYAGLDPRDDWSDLLAEPGELACDAVPFTHPLYVLYSSGTTGLPKAIVHGHGGITVEHQKTLALHHDLWPGQRFFWFTTTGWIMWNIVTGGLLLGCTVVCYDGNPAYPSLERIWDMAEREGITYLGTSAAFLHTCMREGVRPDQGRSFPALRGLGTTGSPLSVEGFAWVYEHVKGDLFLGSISGGTDVSTAFLGCAPWLPVRAGELQASCLGVAAAAVDETGQPVVDQLGELVITEPMPSMPIRFWNDEGGRRYRDSYFTQYPGWWRHGDWVKHTPDGSWVVYGRSDATLNRGGVRMGTSEFYAVLDTFPELADALVVDTTVIGSDTGALLLLVAPAGAAMEAVDDELVRRIRTALRTKLSPRHVPDEVIVVPVLPRTLNGKRLEVPVRRMFLGTDPATAADPSSVNDPAALAALGDVAARWLSRGT